MLLSGMLLSGSMSAMRAASVTRLTCNLGILEQRNPWPHVATRHHQAQPAPVCRHFSVRQSIGMRLSAYFDERLYTVCYHGHVHV